MLAKLLGRSRQTTTELSEVMTTISETAYSPEDAHRLQQAVAEKVAGVEKSGEQEKDKRYQTMRT